MDKYLRLPNGNKIKVFNFTLTNAFIAKFMDANIQELKDFFGTEIIDYIDIVDKSDTILENYNIYMKRKSISTEPTTVMEYEDRIVKEAWSETKEITDEETGEVKEITINHPAMTEKIAKEVPCDITTVILEKPSMSEEIDNVKNAIGMVNTNNMTLDEFKNYHKTQIGKLCTAAIENGSDVETSKGIQHFSYTIEDQSNIKDLVIIWLLVEVLKTKLGSDIDITFPYHADGNLCDVYESNDILKIYMALSSNKTYHTTYCNLLNAIINKCADMNSVKSITYGMEITDEEYLSVIDKVNNSKDTLLDLVSQVISLTSPKEDINDSNKEDNSSKEDTGEVDNKDENTDTSIDEEDNKEDNPNENKDNELEKNPNPDNESEKESGEKSEENKTTDEEVENKSEENSEKNEDSTNSKEEIDEQD